MTKAISRARTEGGFTLIELLIVIVVLGILAGIVIFGVSGVKGDAEAKKTSSNTKICQIAKSTADVQKGDPAKYTDYIDDDTITC
jgi:prepilin-type N-terminal cleavage/methylation domain-containing protein